ncbi:thioesterase domain-containing protein [Xanthomonas sp. MUS 060]|uniref:thioesterase domain-containing protein n=1 Tax=Xanthomonas sp. MUS 060 TaxID=1588031 RepID=UPI0005F292BE|nr:thioesterase domain-containing protein [Xanthomonas sp. MUS 060]
MGLNDNFFNLGGHSLLATQLFSRIRQSFDIEVRVNTLFESPVLEDFAAVVERGMRQSHAGSMPVSLIVPLSLRTERAAMYAIHPIGGQIHCYIDLAAALGHCARVYGLQCEPVRRFAHLSDLAAHYCDALLAGPTGAPYRLLGWSSGGVLALAVAEQLQRRGLRVDYVGLLDSSLIPVHAREPRQLTFVAALNTLAALAKRGFEQAEIDEARQLLFADGDDEHVFDYSRHQASLDKLLAHLRFTLESRMWPPLAEQLRVTRYHLGLLAGFEPQCLQPNAHLYQAQTAVHVSYADMSKPRGGSEVLPDITRYVPLSQIRSAAGNHYSILQGDPLRELARMLVTDLDA